MNMDALWKDTLQEHYTVLKAIDSDRDLNERIVLASLKITKAIQTRHKIVIFGNGGSAADAQHLAAEFVGRYRKDRSPWNVFALSANTAILTAVANDYSYDTVFERQISAFLQPEDIAIGLTTSGASENVLRGLAAARKNEAYTIAMTGQSYTPGMADLVLSIPADQTPRVQEMHLLIGHYWADYAENNVIDPLPQQTESSADSEGTSFHFIIHSEK